MESEGREVSTRQVRIALVLIGALVIGLAILSRQPSEIDSSPGNGQHGLQVESGGRELPDPDSEFGYGLQDPESEWRRVAEHAGIEISDVDQALAQAEAALAEGRLIAPAGSNALDLFIAVRDFDPENPVAVEGLKEIRSRLIDQLTSAVAARDMEVIDRVFPSLDRISQEDEEIELLAEQVSIIKRAETLTEQAREDMAAGKLIQPRGDNALARLLRVREIDPARPDLKDALAELERRLIGEAMASARSLDFVAAENWLEWASRVRGGSTPWNHARATVADYKQIQIDQLTDRARAAMRLANFESAAGEIRRLRGLGADEVRTNALEEELRLSRLYGVFRPGEVFNDRLLDGSAVGPLMKVIPSGSFLMGSAPGEEGHTGYEEPLHPVTFSRGFALATTEITVAQFRQFVADTDYQTDADREGYTSVYNELNGRNTRSRKARWFDGFNGRPAPDEHPVVHVSWNDARAYAAWLRATTGAPYRLPTEAEFEYALRAGSSTPYWWGSGSPEQLVENTTGDGDRSRRRRSWNRAFSDYDDGFWGTAPVASFQANGFGLYDMAGNVQEWVEDCWHDSYVRSPGDGRAWVNRGCQRRVVRGGFWGGEPNTARSAYRVPYSAETRGSAIGFRVARDLLPQTNHFAQAE